MRQETSQRLSKVAFLDRDGTLIFEPEDTHQIDSRDKLSILKGVIEGLRALKGMGYQLFIVSNQDGLGTSLFPKTDFENAQDQMLRIFERHGVRFEGIFICPHLPGGNCDCRKPRTGLVDGFLKRKKKSMDWQSSFVCGDRESDRLFARNLGIRFIPMKTNGNFTDVIRELEEKSP